MPRRPDHYFFLAGDLERDGLAGALAAAFAAFAFSFSRSIADVSILPRRVHTHECLGQGSSGRAMGTGWFLHICEMRTGSH